MGESNTVVSAYSMYRHLQHYCSHPLMWILNANTLILNSGNDMFIKMYPGTGYHILNRTLFQFKNRRCLSMGECLNFTFYRGERNKQPMLKLVIPETRRIPGECVYECGEGFRDDPTNTSKCIPCRGKCPKGKVKLFDIKHLLYSTKFRN